MLLLSAYRWLFISNLCCFAAPACLYANIQGCTKELEGVLGLSLAAFLITLWATRKLSKHGSAGHERPESALGASAFERGLVLTTLMFSVFFSIWLTRGILKLQSPAIEASWMFICLARNLGSNVEALVRLERAARN